jgi:hypothetical protein
VGCINVARNMDELQSFVKRPVKYSERHKMQGLYSVAEELLSSKEGLCCMELFSRMICMLKQFNHRYVCHGLHMFHTMVYGNNL